MGRNPGLGSDCSIAGRESIGREANSSTARLRGFGRNDIVIRRGGWCRGLWCGGLVLRGLLGGLLLGGLVFGVLVVLEVGGGDLECVEEEPGSAGIDVVVGDAGYDLAEGVLDGGAAGGSGELEGVAAGLA